MLFNKLMQTTASALPIEVSFLQTASNVNNLSSYTFSNQNIGTEFAGRIVLIGVSTVLVTTARTFSSVTVNGVTATLINRSGGTGDSAGLFAVALDSGTSATIVVNFSGVVSCCGLAIWTLKNAIGYNVEAFPNALNSQNTAQSQTFTFSQVKKGDAIIVMSRIRSANVGTYSVTGATERFDENVESGVSGQFGGDAMISAAQTNYNVIISTSGTSPASNNSVTRLYK